MPENEIWNGMDIFKITLFIYPFYPGTTPPPKRNILPTNPIILNLVCRQSLVYLVYVLCLYLVFLLLYTSL